MERPSFGTTVAMRSTVSRNKTGRGTTVATDIPCTGHCAVPREFKEMVALAARPTVGGSRTFSSAAADMGKNSSAAASPRNKIVLRMVFIICLDRSAKEYWLLEIEMPGISKWRYVGKEFDWKILASKRFARRRSQPSICSA